MVDSYDFVHQCCKTKGWMPNFICYTENQRNDLLLFLSQKSEYPIGVDRTFNLGRFFVTALVYKNLRIVRADNAKEHPLFIGPVFIHRDATFEAYNYFFATVKASLCPKKSIRSFDLRLGKDMYIGNDEEQALVNAIASSFPASNQFLCTKHLKNGTLNYLQTKVGVPQKDRLNIRKSIFGEKGKVNANKSFDFDRNVKNVVVKAANYPMFSEYFKNKLQPSIKTYVNAPSRKAITINNWTNNNCESLNYIMEIDANWKVKNSPKLIRTLHEMTLRILEEPYMVQEIIVSLVSTENIRFQEICGKN